MKTNSLGIYIHIPFCKSKCAYCDFYSLPDTNRREKQMDAYAEALCVHISRTAFQSAYSVDTVYFGGGTPSLMGKQRLLRIWNAVKNRCSVSPDAEITLEANPDSVGDWLGSLREAGFNRISLGMQSADDGELREIGRVHTFAQVREAVRAIRRAGFENLSLDLIYGLPGQTMRSWRDSLHAALDLQPEHLSCYGLKVEAGTPLYARVYGGNTYSGAYGGAARPCDGGGNISGGAARLDQITLPDDGQQADSYLFAAGKLARHGYRQYEISNFARPGMESRHNLKYWTLGEYIGFGPGAHSDFGGARYAYARDLAAYLRGVQAGRPACTERTPITPEERAREWIMLGLRTVQGLDTAQGRRRFGLDFSACETFLRQCEQAGYVRREAGRIFLTPRGFLVSNQIIGAVLEIFQPANHCVQ